MGWPDREEAKRHQRYMKPPQLPWAASGVLSLLTAPDGMTKLIFDKESHRVIGGAIIVGTNGGGCWVKSGCSVNGL